MKVVTFDSDAPLSERHYYIGTSNYRAGQVCYDLVKEALPEGGKVAVLLSNLRKNNMINRKAGFADSAAKDQESAQSDPNSTEDPKWDIVGYLTDLSETASIGANNGDQAKEAEQQCIKNIKQILEEHEDLSGIVGMNGYHGPLLLKVLKETGHLGKVKLVTFDWPKETLEGIESGHIYGTVAQDPYSYGYEAIVTLTDLLKGTGRKQPLIGGGQALVPCKSVRKDNLAEFRSDIMQLIDGEEEKDS